MKNPLYDPTQFLAFVAHIAMIIVASTFGFVPALAVIGAIIMQAMWGATLKARAEAALQAKANEPLRGPELNHFTDARMKIYASSHPMLLVNQLARLIIQLRKDLKDKQ